MFHFHFLSKSHSSNDSKVKTKNERTEKNSRKKNCGSYEADERVGSNLATQ